jgi:transposase-like protein
MDKSKEKEEVIKEYLLGGTSTRKLGQKYGYGPSTVLRWVMSEKKEKDKLALLHASKLAAKEKEEMPTDVKQLQEALRDSRLKICLLEAMIDISDEQFGTDIRKKAGTRPS